MIRVPRLRPLLALLLALTLAAGTAACGSKSSSSSQAEPAGGTTTQTIHLAKTKFALHAGLAFGAFHRYIYKPYKEGKFSGGLFHHKLATLKAALAAAFAYHEVKLALEDARSSKLLSTVLAPLLALQNKLASLQSRLKGGHVDQSVIESANSSAGEAGTSGAAAGQPISDQPTPQLGV
jgi:hypothetical protein